MANGDLAEAVAIGPKEVLINGKAPGETSLIVWQEDGTRLIYDLTVRMSPARLDAVREQIARDFPDDDINVTFDNDAVFVRGTVKDVIAADRVMAIAATLGKAVNLLRVESRREAQILLKVRFADVDRSASRDLAVDLASGAFNQSTAVGAWARRSAPTAAKTSSPSPNAVNIFLFRKDLNLVAAFRRWKARTCWRCWRSRTCRPSTASRPVFAGRRRVPVPHGAAGSAAGGTVTHYPGGNTASGSTSCP